jgi:hypothetical protein
VVEVEVLKMELVALVALVEVELEADSKQVVKCLEHLAQQTLVVEVEVEVIFHLKYQVLQMVKLVAQE